MSTARRLKRWRRQVHLVLDQGVGRAWVASLVHGALIALITVNVIATVLESVPALAGAHGRAFAAIEIVSVVAFALEYALRLWTVPEQVQYQGRPPLQARLSYAVSVPALVDLVAILPVYFALVGGGDLKVLLLLRLFRFLKLARYSAGLRSLGEAVYKERNALLASLIVLAGVALLAATAMYLAEAHVQPDKFGTIPEALWWAIVTLTTVGYGDVVPVTGLGRVIAGITALMGLVMLALPVGIIATAFAENIHRRDFVVTWSMVARVPLFATLNASQIAEIMRFLRAQTAPAGTMIVRRGEPAHSMYFIAAGMIEIELPDKSVRLDDGHFFGEMAILRATRRSASARAIVATKLLVLDARDVHALMDRHPAVAHAIREAAHRRGLALQTGGRPGDLAGPELKDDAERTD